MAKIIPSMSKVQNTAVTGLKGGLAGGLGYAIGNRIAGPLGAGIGTVLAGSMIGKTEGTVVAINGVMDLVAQMFSGAGQTQQQEAI